MHSFPARTSFGLLTLLATGCGFGHLDKPTPPDTEQARNLLDHPDGRFTEGDTAHAMYKSIESVLRTFEAVCGYDPVVDAACLAHAACRRCALLAALGNALEKLAASLHSTANDEQTGEDGRTIPGVAGLLNVDINCKGFDETPEPDPSHGFIHLTVGFTGRGLDPVVWGDFDDCATLNHGQPVRLTGDFTLEFDAEAVRATALQTTPAIFSFDGEVVAVKEATLDEGRLIIHQRLDGKGDLAVGLGSDTIGTFVVDVTRTGAELAGADGSFICNAEESTCELSEDR